MLRDISIVCCCVAVCGLLFFFFFFNDTATTEIYTLSLHDALPILSLCGEKKTQERMAHMLKVGKPLRNRSEEHTSELQSRLHLVCRLLLEKKKQIKKHYLTRVQKKIDNTK